MYVTRLLARFIGLYNPYYLYTIAPVTSRTNKPELDRVTAALAFLTADYVANNYLHASFID
jgi:hypothetical protein